MTSRLALDGGQSGCRARDAAGHIWEGVGIDTSRPRIPQLAAAVRAAAPEGAEHVLVGTTGLGVEDTAAALLDELRDHGTQSVHLAHDSVTSYLGALGDRTGCVVAAGTGVVTLAAGVTTAARVDGWGWILGDAGSGFWIGRRAIDMALRAYDGRGPATALLDLVRADFGDPSLAYLTLQDDPRRVTRTPTYAKQVDALAETAAVDLGAVGGDLGGGGLPVLDGGLDRGVGRRVQARRQLGARLARERLAEGGPELLAAEDLSLHEVVVRSLERTVRVVRRTPGHVVADDLAERLRRRAAVRAEAAVLRVQGGEVGPVRRVRRAVTRVRVGHFVDEEPGHVTGIRLVVREQLREVETDGVRPGEAVVAGHPSADRRRVQLQHTRLRVERVEVRGAADRIEGAPDHRHDRPVRLVGPVLPREREAPVRLDPGLEPVHG